MTKMLLPANYRLCRCNVVIEKLLLSNHRLCRCSAMIVILMPVKYSL